VRLLQRLTQLTYPKEKLQIIVIDDASMDKTGEIAESYASRNPSLIKVVHRSVGGLGKAPVLNEGLKDASGEILGFFDADYLPERDILEKMVPYFTDANVGIVQGGIYVLNERESCVSRIVTLERLGGYCVSQHARDLLGLIPQFGGTVGLVRRSLLLKLGGFSVDTLAEDTDLTFRVVLEGFDVKYIIEAQSGEQAVKSLHAYWRQRTRWAVGHMQCAFKHIFPLLKSGKVSRWKKVDGLLVLSMYFLPLLTMFSAILFILTLMFKVPMWLPFEMTFASNVLFSLNGNVAPFMEIVTASFIEHRRRLIGFCPVLLIAYFLNTLICTKALFQLIITKLTGEKLVWQKTTH